MSTLLQAPAQFPSSSFTIPSSVTTIGSFAFRVSSLTSIDIPGTVTTIGSGAFAGADFTDVTLHEGLITIDNDAFITCGQLTSIAIPASVQYIGIDAFFLCTRLEKVSLPHTAVVKQSAFSICSNLKYIFYTGSSEDWAAAQITVPSGAYVHYDCEPMSFDHYATCVSDGACIYCDVTGVTPAHHSYTNYVSENNATCTADGTKIAACDYGCNTTDEITDEGSMLDHDFTKEVVSEETKRSDATTEAKATYWYTCQSCGEAISDTLYFEYGDLLPTEATEPEETTVSTEAGETTTPSETTKPTEAVNPSSPQTGDSFALGLALPLLILSIALTTVLIIKSKEI